MYINIIQFKSSWRLYWYMQIMCRLPIKKNKDSRDSRFEQLFKYRVIIKLIIKALCYAYRTFFQYSF